MFSGINVCAGKPATARNAFSSPWGNPQTPLTETKNTATSAGNAFYSGTSEVGNWWQVDLGHPGFQITEIRFRTRNDCCGQDSSRLQIVMLDNVCACMLFVSFVHVNLTSCHRMESKLKVRTTSFSHQTLQMVWIVFLQQRPVIRLRGTTMVRTALLRGRRLLLLRG